MHEIPKTLTEKEFAKRLQIAKETLNEYNCKNDIEKGLIVMSGWVSADGQPVYTPAQLKRLFDLGLCTSCAVARRAAPEDRRKI